MTVAVTVGLVVIAVLPATAVAKSAPPPPRWVRQALDALPAITQAEGFEDVEIRAVGRTTSIDNAFTFDTGAHFFSSDITTGDNLDEVLTVYVSGDTAWLDVANPAFSSQIPDGKRFVTVPVQDLTATGLVSSDPKVWFAPLYALLGVTHVKPKPLEGAGHHVYDFGVDLDAARRAVPDDVRAAFVRAYGSVPAGKRVRAGGSATIDDQHHVLDFEVRFDITTAAHPIRLTLTLGLDRVNISVDTATPPATQSVPIDSVPGLRQQLQKLTGGPTPNPVAGST